ncbi:MAG: tetratricopeptide repeat protein, partial [SAR324 cluster bacterium]|nr:tetratricopeptide repeat protein [SAR324 cluster bacterium]
QKKYDLAEAAYKKALELDPNQATTHNNLGYLYVELNHLQKAEELISRAIELDSTNPVYHVSLGELYVKQEKLNEAEAAFKKALELDPRFSYALVRLGWTYHQEAISGRAESPQALFDRTIEMVNKALALDDCLSDAYGVLCGALRYKFEHEKAIECGERAVALNRNDADSNGFLSLVLSEVGRGEEALERAEIALRLEPVPPAWYLRTLGAAYRILGRFEEAIAVHRKCVEQLPDFLHAQLGLVLTYMESGQEAKGREQAVQVLRIDSKFSCSNDIFVSLFKDAAVRERCIELLRKAGLPD